MPADNRGQIIPSRYIRVPLWRRGAALLVDFMAVGLVSLVISTGAIAQLIVFMLGWMGLRVLLVSRNHGQSLGRWAFDMMLVDGRSAGIPGLTELSLREAPLGFAVFLVLVGLVNFNPSTPWAPLLFIPLVADASLAWLDPDKNQTFHDQWTQTLVVQSRRGYSLDLKIQRLLADLKRRVK